MMPDGPRAKSGGSMSGRWLLLCVSLGAAIWSAPARGQRTGPDRADEFIAWCTNAPNREDCRFWIGTGIKLYSGSLRTSACTALEQRVNRHEDEVVDAVYQWLRAQSSQLPGDLLDAIGTATTALYRCP